MTTRTRRERRCETAVHHLLHVLKLAIPVTGYVISTSSGGPVSLWAGLEAPALWPVGGALRDVAIELHYYCAYTLAVLVLVHAGAAPKHQLLDREDTPRRMLW